MSESRTLRLFVSVRELWRDRRRWVLVGLIVSAALAFYAARGSQQWTATTQAFVDSNPSLVGNGATPVDPVQDHAGVYTSVLVSQAGINAVARASGLPADEIAATNLGGDQTAAQFYTPSSGSARYSITLQPWDLAPEIFITAAAPTRKDAVALANGTVRGLDLYLEQLAGTRASSHPAATRQLGSPVIHSVGAGISLLKLALGFFLALAIWCGLIKLAERLLRLRRLSTRRPSSEPTGSGDQVSVGLASTLADRDREAVGTY